MEEVSCKGVMIVSTQSQVEKRRILTSSLDPAYNGALLANDHDVITVAVKSVFDLNFVMIFCAYLMPVTASTPSASQVSVSQKRILDS